MTAVPITLDGAAGLRAHSTAVSFSEPTRRKLLILFFMALVLPIQPEVGGQRLDPYRLLLLVLFFPFVAAMIKRRAGQITLSDIFMGCYAL